MSCGTDNIIQNIFEYFPHSNGNTKKLSIPYNIVMDPKCYVLPQENCKVFVRAAHPNETCRYDDTR